MQQIISTQVSNVASSLIKNGVYSACVIGSVALQRRLAKVGCKSKLETGYLIVNNKMALRHVWVVVDEVNTPIDIGRLVANIFEYGSSIDRDDFKYRRDKPLDSENLKIDTSDALEYIISCIKDGQISPKAYDKKIRPKKFKAAFLDAVNK